LREESVDLAILFLSFLPGQTTKTVDIWVYGDTDVEPDETFFMNLLDPHGATIADSQGIATIVNDDFTYPGSFFTVTPCRAVDTRGPIDGPALSAGETRVVSLFGSCGIPPTAKAISVNLAVTAPTAGGNLRLYPAGAPLPLVSAINYSAGQTRANNTIVPLSLAGELAVYCAQASGTTHFILDVNGYFE
jgi:hypothetical protein